VSTQEKYGKTCEIIDLRTLSPWDQDTVIASVKKTGKCVVSHEAPITGGFAGEIASTIQVRKWFFSLHPPRLIAWQQQKCFTSLEAPVERVCGWDTPFPLAFEGIYLPDKLRCVEAIYRTLHYDQLF
jgi:2-oxoisovalerate dehydrogenase E1 component beta subunit